MRIIPALLTDQKEIFSKMLVSCARFTDYVQVDIMDGEFVPSKSISADDLRGVPAGEVGSEAHLMVTQPLDWIEAFKDFGSAKIIFHFEAVKDHREVISAIKSREMAAGMAVNPSTPVAAFESLVEELDSILFMSVVPGFYGSAFVPSVLDKIVEFRKKFPLKSAGIDGGVKQDNAARIASSGVDDICVGSALLKAPDPAAAFEEFMRIVNA